MKKLMSIFIIFSLLSVSSDSYASLNKIKLVHQVVKITAFENKENGGYISATAFPIDKETFLTAGHFCSAVVESKDKNGKDRYVQLIFYTYLNIHDEFVTGFGLLIERYQMNDNIDLCIMKKQRHGFVPLKISKYFFMTKIGQKVTTVGAALGIMFPNITDGYVTQVVSENFSLAILNGKLLTSIPVAPGNSGGPVLNEKGEVIGVLVMGAIPFYEHISFSVGADKVQKFLNGE